MMQSHTVATVESVTARLGDVTVMPASFAQQRFWLLDQMVEDQSAYTLPVALRLVGQLDVSAFVAALNAVVARHESLRTLFALDGEAPAQIVLPSLQLDVPVMDLEGLTDAERTQRVLDEVHSNANTAFDLASGPLIRASLLRTASDEHVLLVALHHLIADGWSMGILFDELGAAYDAFTAASVPAFDELTLQYPDYAVWQRKVMTGKTAAKQLEFWREKLAQLDPLELPTDFARPAVLTTRGGKRELAISAAVADGMRALARRESVTAYSAFLATFFALLHRYSGQDNFAVATIASGRLRPEVEPLIGLFVNTLSIRSPVRADEPFTALLRSVAHQSALAQANQNVPFEHVIDALKFPRDASRPAGVQVCCQLLEGLGREPRLAGIEISRVPSVKQSSKFELTLMLHPAANGELRAVLEYASDLFEADTVDRMLSHYVNMLAGIVRDENTLVGRLPMLGAAERIEVLERWNHTAQPLPSWCVPDRVLAQAEETPEAIAVRAGTHELTYAQLVQQSATLALALQQSGVVVGSRVAVCVERTTDLLVALLGVLRVGAAYVPIDASYPSDRIAYVLGDAGAVAVVTDAVASANLPWTSLPVVRVDALDPPSSGTFVDAAISGEALAYVLYTSGSTGLPKGVMVPHRALANFLQSMSERPGLQSCDAIVAVTTLAFDIAGLELWLPLIVGAHVELASREVAIDGAQLAKLIAVVSERVGAGNCLLQATPATWRLLVESGWTGTRNLTMLCGGEGWPAGLAEQLLSRGAALWNVYGPTETTIWSSRAHVTLAGPPALGEPLANTTLYVFERDGEPAPLGVPGELHIGGAGLARGYHNRPELTAERFIERAPFGRLYRTGDLVVRRGNGRLEYLGRLDDQIKLRGYRIELGEIEAVLSAQPEVSQAIVTVRAVGTPPEPQLVAYLVLANPSDESASGISGVLTSRLRVALPSYMVPAIFVTLPTMPLTPNGKADRRALPAPDVGALIKVEYVAPRTALEKSLTNVWQQVFGRETIGVHDDFFALGGHSLMAMRVLARLDRDLPARITIGTLLGARTIAALAEAIISRAGASNTGTPAFSDIIPRRPYGSAAPLSYGQELLWLYEQMTPGTAAYHLPMARRVRGSLNVDALGRALSTIVQRHEALRTAFVETAAGVEQVLCDAMPVAVETHDLRNLPLRDRESEAATILKAVAVRPFDLATGELLRAVAVRVGDEEHLLLLVVHHIVFDGASVGVLFRELSVLYDEDSSSDKTSLPPLAVQFADYATWERTQLEEARLAPALAFWKRQLAEAPSGIDLPTDFTRPATTSGPGARFSTTFSEGALQAVRTLAKQNGATPFMVLLAAFQAVLYRHSNQADFVIGVPVAGRARVETEPLIGYLANTLALRATFEDGQSFARLLSDVRRTTLAAFDNATIPYEKLVRELRLGQPAESQTLFRVFFALQDSSIAPAPLGRATIESFGVDVGSAKFDLSLSVTELPHGIRAVMEYRSDLFRATSIERLLEHVEILLMGAAENSTLPVARLPLLAGAERTLLLDTWNETAVRYPQHETLASLLEMQAERTPDAVAVVDADRTITYRELNARSTALATRLRERGARAGMLIGVCAERSSDLVVALHAVVKSGAAYVPLDPEYPADRLAYMLEDSATPIILAQTHLAHLLPGNRVMIVDSPSEAESTTVETGDVPRAEDPAYMIYTSGSTGRPKGALNAHRGIVNRLLWMQNQYPLTTDDAVLQKTPFSFDVSVWEFFWPLITGARLVMAEPGGHRDPSYLARIVDEHHVTVLHFVPSMLRAFLSALPADASLDTVRHVMASGEALTADLVPPFRRAFTNAALNNLYGPTECAVDATHWTVPRHGELTVVPIGRPVANTQMYVLDAMGAPTPVGVAGELHIGGVQVGLGYHKKPELTAEKFIPDPFGTSASARLYRTGDLARWNVDGDLEYLGRLDFQVKIRGFRIELGEIESTLGTHEGVRESVVVARNAGTADARLVAYVVLGTTTTSILALREHLARTLPEYMVPGQFVVLDSLPLSNNGKVDRRALPHPTDVFEESRPFVAPKNDIERVVAGIWCEMLKREQISVDTPFFEVGGHSLLATRIAGKAGTLFRTTVPLRRFFENPTVSGMAATLVSLEAKPGQATAIAALLLKLQNMTPEEREQLRKNRTDAARLAHTTG